MMTYFALIFFSFLFCFVAKSKKKGKLYIGSGKKISENNLAISVFFLMLWFLLACRSVEIGTDTENYQFYFDRYKHMNFFRIVEKPEPLFGVLNWLIGKVTNDFQIYMAIVAAINIIPIAFLYNQDKRHSYLKIILFVNMSVFVMLFSGIRQSIAMGIGLVAFHFVKKKKLVSFLITVIIALGFHQSAFILFAMYPLYYFRIKKKHIYYLIPLIAIVYIFNQRIFSRLLIIMRLFGTKYDEYAEIGGTGAVMMIICFAAFTIFAYIIPDATKEDNEFIGIRNYLLLATLIQCFAPLHNWAMRMNYYYILFLHYNKIHKSKSK